ncbi:MAG TPA: hypothetical protein DHU79_03980 [Clostridiales bacterium]|nr:hypothetical protein [Clostridiales bacterium]
MPEKYIRMQNPATNYGVLGATNQQKAKKSISKISEFSSLLSLTACGKLRQIHTLWKSCFA